MAGPVGPGFGGLGFAGPVGPGFAGPSLAGPIGLGRAGPVGLGLAGSAGFGLAGLGSSSRGPYGGVYSPYPYQPNPYNLPYQAAFAPIPT